MNTWNCYRGTLVTTGVDSDFWAQVFNIWFEGDEVAACGGKVAEGLLPNARQLEMPSRTVRGWWVT